MSEENEFDLPDIESFDDDMNLPDMDSFDDDMNLPDMDSFGDDMTPENLHDNSKVEIERTIIMIVGSDEIHNKFINCLPEEHLFRVIHTLNSEEAISYLIQEQIAITFLDYFAIPNTTVLSSSINQYIPLSRIVLMAPLLDINTLSHITNSGSINAILPLPFDQSRMMQVLAQQEAKFAINKMLVNMITEPPNLSQASFLLLDPTLEFGSDKAPLNFVGVMIVCQTIPKYTKFFEKTLAQDEMLFAGYLTSIASLGATLFENKEALKEINFGGISVIFQFHKELQIFFFVKNLTRNNFPKAEERVSKFAAEIVEKYFDTFLHDHYISQKTFEELDILADAFNREDEIEQEKFEQNIEKEEISTDITLVLIYSRSESGAMVSKLLHGKKESSEDNYNMVIDEVSDEEVLIAKIRDFKHHVILIDSDCDTGDRSRSDFIDFIKETLPSIQVIYMEREEMYTDTVIESYNSDTLNYLLPFDVISVSLYHTFVEAEKEAKKIKKHSSSSTISDTAGNMDAMKLYLRKEQEAYNIENQPELIGMIIAQELIPVFDEFWDDENKYDTEMITGLVKSLDNVGSEMFFEKEEIQLLELGGNHVFVRSIGPYMFSFFVKNNNPTTTVIVNREIEALCNLYVELLHEAAGVLSYVQLKPIFSKLANESHDNFTNLLRESQRNNQNSD